MTHGANNNGNPWTQYWFCDYLFWRIDGYTWEGNAYGVLRMMVSTQNATCAYEGLEYGFLVRVDRTVQLGPRRERSEGSRLQESDDEACT